MSSNNRYRSHATHHKMMAAWAVKAVAMCAAAGTVTYIVSRLVLALRDLH